VSNDSISAKLKTKLTKELTNGYEDCIKCNGYIKITNINLYSEVLEA